MNWLWSSGGGGSIFDPYSLYHIVFFITLTLLLYPVFEKNVWAAVLSLAFVWEVCEYWINENIPWFPYVGKENWYNKIIGDPISNFIGFLIAMYLINKIRKIENERFKKTGVEENR